MVLEAPRIDVLSVVLAMGDVHGPEVVHCARPFTHPSVGHTSLARSAVLSRAANVLHFCSRTAAESYLSRNGRPATPFQPEIPQSQFEADKHHLIILDCSYVIERIPSCFNRHLSSRRSPATSLRPFPILLEPIEAVLPDQNTLVFLLLPLSEPVAYPIRKNVIWDRNRGEYTIRINGD